jgi:signal transduction histidine kinase/CheY-like chemotaxis protein
VLELRRERSDGLWVALAQRSIVARRVLPARTGSLLAFARDGARIVTNSVRRIFARLFSLQKRIETAFHASGAAAQLADAALAGDATPELAARIARIARELSGSAGAAVHLRSPGGVQLLGSDGEAPPRELAERALSSGKVEWSKNAAAVPLTVRDELVGSLSLSFDGGLRDLRALQPLLSRAGAVLAAAEREARKDRFLSLAAHELKTPLTSIKGFSYSLARRLEKGEPCDPRHVQVLERQAERLHSLLEEMLEVSRIETGRFVLHQEPCEAHDLVEASLRSLKRLAPDFTVDVSAEPGLMLVADRERIERALTAMLLRARALGTAVRIEARRDGLRVSWHGRPLPEAERAAAFAPRWELPQAQRQGLGMALAVARDGAQLHGGRLRAEPLAFVLELPLRAARPDQSAPASAGSVLVVDDDEPLARMLAEFLSEHGFQTDWAGGGRAALEKIRASRPDAVVLDLRMPEMDGRALLALVRAAGFSPRVVLLSADRSVADAARELDCEAFVEKPFAPEGLLAAVRTALSGSRASPALPRAP